MNSLHIFIRVLQSAPKEHIFQAEQVLDSHEILAEFVTKCNENLRPDRYLTVYFWIRMYKELRINSVMLSPYTLKNL